MTIDIIYDNIRILFSVRFHKYRRFACTRKFGSEGSSRSSSLDPEKHRSIRRRPKIGYYWWLQCRKHRCVITHVITNVKGSLPQRNRDEWFSYTIRTTTDRTKTPSQETGRTVGLSNRHNRIHVDLFEIKTNRTIYWNYAAIFREAYLF